VVNPFLQNGSTMGSIATAKRKRKQHPLYFVWHNMKKRCYRTENKDYRYYGGRGIRVCSEWLADSKSFMQWAIGHGWQVGLQIDRIDSDGDYEPMNCRFVTRYVNNRNRTDNVWITAFGETKCLQDWVCDKRCTAKGWSSLKHRLVVLKLSPEEAITRPYGRWIKSE